MTQLLTVVNVGGVINDVVDPQLKTIAGSVTSGGSPIGDEQALPSGM